MRTRKVLIMKVLHIGMKTYVVGNISEFRMKTFFLVSLSEVIRFKNLLRT